MSGPCVLRGHPYPARNRTKSLHPSSSIYPLEDIRIFLQLQGSNKDACRTHPSTTGGSLAQKRRMNGMILLHTLTQARAGLSQKQFVPCLALHGWIMNGSWIRGNGRSCLSEVTFPWSGNLLGRTCQPLFLASSIFDLPRISSYAWFVPQNVSSTSNRLKHSG